ncbi:MAG: alpha/beta hydrolase [Spirochaetia bacterium]|nr:alpha/beta hydrolase [Spirochaetia bacterium]
METIFKSPEKKEKILEWYDKFKNKIKYPLESMEIQTSFGKTHLLTGGPADGVPVVILHGAMASSAHLLYELQGLLENYRVYAVDIIGQSVKSEDRRISVKNNDYGIWLKEVFENLNLKKVNLIGVSWGGFVGIRTAVTFPELIEKLVLLVPAGLVNGNPFSGMAKLAFPMYLYQKKPTPERLHNFTKNLLTTLDDDWVSYIGDAFLNYKMDMTVPKLATKKELIHFQSPAYVLAAGEDISFPGQKLIEKSKKIFPNLVKTELLKNSKHSPPTTDEFRKWMAGQIAEFIG